MRSIILYCLIFIVLSNIGADEIFRFQQREGEEYRIVSEVEEFLLYNDELLAKAQILNRILIRVNGLVDGVADLSVEYEISEKVADSELYAYSRDETVDFKRSDLGEYIDIPIDSDLPSVRHIPTFPEGALNEGDSWSAMAEEFHDLEPFFKVSHTLGVQYRVFYTYEGRQNFDGKELDIIKMNYHYYQPINLTIQQKAPEGYENPTQVAGDFNIIYYWDPAVGLPAAVSEDFTMRYTMESGSNYTFRGYSNGYTQVAEDWEKEDLIEDVQDLLQDQDVSVRVGEEGLILSLDDVQFKADSAQFYPGELDKLDALIEVLRQFSDHDLAIVGHTAAVGFSDGIELSFKRAQAVANYLLEKGVRDSTQMTIDGVGASQPLGDNSNDEGRQKNRRVEITILDN